MKEILKVNLDDSGILHIDGKASIEDLIFVASHLIKEAIHMPPFKEFGGHN